MRTLAILLLLSACTTGGYESRDQAGCQSPSTPQAPATPDAADEPRVCEPGEALCPCPDSCEDPCWCDTSCLDCGCPDLPEPVCPW